MGQPVGRAFLLGEFQTVRTFGGVGGGVAAHFDFQVAQVRFLKRLAVVGARGVAGGPYGDGGVVVERFAGSPVFGKVGVQVAHVGYVDIEGGGIGELHPIGHFRGKRAVGSTVVGGGLERNQGGGAAGRRTQHDAPGGQGEVAGSAVPLEFDTLALHIFIIGLPIVGHAHAVVVAFQLEGAVARCRHIVVIVHRHGHIAEHRIADGRLGTDEIAGTGRSGGLLHLFEEECLPLEAVECLQVVVVGAEGLVEHGFRSIERQADWLPHTGNEGAVAEGDIVGGASGEAARVTPPVGGVDVDVLGGQSLAGE